jgi:hypothetical protein
MDPAALRRFPNRHYKSGESPQGSIKRKSFEYIRQRLHRQQVDLPYKTAVHQPAYIMDLGKAKMGHQVSDLLDFFRLGQEAVKTDRL